MSESVIADFVARFAVGNSSEPYQGRVVLSQKRIVIANGDSRWTIPLSSVYDVLVGRIDPEIAEYFDDTVTIRYTRDGAKRTVAIECDRETLERFTTVLFKALLSGTTVLVRHPARKGGRVLDTGARKAILRLDPGSFAFEFEGGRDPLAFNLSEVAGFDRRKRTMQGKRRPIVSLRVSRGDYIETIEISLPTERKNSVFSRYVHRGYKEVKEKLSELSISDDEARALVAIYAAGGDADLEWILDESGDRITALLNSLRGKGLLTVDEDPTPTRRGLAAVDNRADEYL